MVRYLLTYRLCWTGYGLNFMSLLALAMGGEATHNRVGIRNHI